MMILLSGKCRVVFPEAMKPFFTILRCSFEHFTSDLTNNGGISVDKYVSLQITDTPYITDLHPGMKGQTELQLRHNSVTSVQSLIFMIHFDAYMFLME